MLYQCFFSAVSQSCSTKVLQHSSSAALASPAARSFEAGRQQDPSCKDWLWQDAGGRRADQSIAGTQEARTCPVLDRQSHACNATSRQGCLCTIVDLSIVVAASLYSMPFDALANTMLFNWAVKICLAVLFFCLPACLRACLPFPPRFICKVNVQSQQLNAYI